MSVAISVWFGRISESGFLGEAFFKLNFNNTLMSLLIIKSFILIQREKKFLVIVKDLTPQYYGTDILRKFLLQFRIARIVDYTMTNIQNFSLAKIVNFVPLSNLWR